MAVITEQ